jgi:hypothetical protein
MLAKHRNSIFRSLTPILGEEETEAMLAHFPTTDGDELVTRQYLDLRLAQLQGEFERSLRQTMMWLVTTNLAVGSVIIALS